MFEVFLKPRIFPLLVDRIGDLSEMVEDEEDIREGLEALADEEGTVTWEQYQLKREEERLLGELSG